MEKKPGDQRLRLKLAAIEIARFDEHRGFLTYSFGYAKSLYLQKGHERYVWHRPKSNWLRSEKRLSATKTERNSQFSATPPYSEEAMGERNSQVQRDFLAQNEANDRDFREVNV